MDWSRIVLPQDDGSDTRAILARAPRHARTLESGGPVLFHGTVRVLPILPEGTQRGCYAPGTPGHPVWAEGERLMGAWPAARVQFGRLFHTIRPVARAAMWPLGIGPRSGFVARPSARRRGEVLVVQGAPEDIARGFVSALALAKVNAVGLDAVFLEGGSLRVPCPTGAEADRSMATVLRAAWVAAYVVELEARWCAQDPRWAQEPEVRHHLELLEQTVSCLRRRAMLTRAGRDLGDALQQVVGRALSRAEAFGVVPPRPVLGAASRRERVMFGQASPA